MNPIYKPKGRAGEYGDYAINIYNSCNHGCTYCYARDMAARFGKPWTGQVKPREGIVEAVERQIARTGTMGQLIHLCFTCDPYPADVDTSVTREVIKAIKQSGNHVQILTKGGTRATRDFDLLDGNDWFGVTITGAIEGEPNAASLSERMLNVMEAKDAGVNTWVSCEPVLNPLSIYVMIAGNWADYVDLFKIGKLNHRPSDIDWGKFGRECERLCIEYGRNYYIKDDLRSEMEKIS